MASAVVVYPLELECCSASCCTMETAWLAGGARRASLRTVRDMAASDALAPPLRWSACLPSQSCTGGTSTLHNCHVKKIDIKTTDIASDLDTRVRSKHRCWVFLAVKGDISGHAYVHGTAFQKPQSPFWITVWLLTDAFWCVYKVCICGRACLLVWMLPFPVPLELCKKRSAQILRDGTPVLHGRSF